MPNVRDPNIHHKIKLHCNENNLNLYPFIISQLLAIASLADNSGYRPKYNSPLHKNMFLQFLEQLIIYTKKTDKHFLINLSLQLV